MLMHNIVCFDEILVRCQALANHSPTAANKLAQLTRLFTRLPH
jgi:hypothetical protein